MYQSLNDYILQSRNNTNTFPKKTVSVKACNTIMFIITKNYQKRGTWMAHSVRHLSLDLGSCHDLDLYQVPPWALF